MANAAAAGSGRARGTYQIGEIARRCSLSLRTLRYWEEVGLISPTSRTPGGYRVYSEGALERVMLIRHMKPIDFSIEELKDLVSLVDSLRAATDDDATRTADAAKLRAFLSRIRSSCEILRGRLTAAESAALDLEALIEGI
jgi:DNA-binding transcriptional MerR regulator